MREDKGRTPSCWSSVGGRIRRCDSVALPSQATSIWSRNESQTEEAQLPDDLGENARSQRDSESRSRMAVIDRAPCTIKLLRVPPGDANFHDFDEYERLVEAAKAVDANTHLVVLLGGDAGLRCGEILALEWTNIDFSNRSLHVKRSDWRGHVTAPKGGRPRRIPLTKRLAASLQDHRHLRGKRVLCEHDGRPLTKRVLQRLVERVSRRANVAKTGLHILRHSFCSHLAMRGAPAKAIQELAGHRDLATTQRYMHLSPAAVEGAIRLLEQPAPVSRFGDILETVPGANEEAKG